MEANVIKIQSLKRTSIAQFAAILLPVIALMGYQIPTTMGYQIPTTAQFAANVKQVFQPHSLVLHGVGKATARIDSLFPGQKR